MPVNAFDLPSPNMPVFNTTTSENDKFLADTRKWLEDLTKR